MPRVVWQIGVFVTKIEPVASGAPAGQPTARGDNPNGARAKSRRSRAVPVDELLVLACDTYWFEREECRPAGVRQTQVGPASRWSALVPGAERRPGEGHTFS